MNKTSYRPAGLEIAPKDLRPGIARMTDIIDVNEKAYWLLQVRLTPYNASKAGLKYAPATWAGTPLIRVIWVNRDGHLAEFQEWLQDGAEVQVPSLWELSVAEVIHTADQHSHEGSEQTEEWLRQAQAESTLIEDAIEFEYQKTEMAFNRSSFGPQVNVQRNGFPQELRRLKLRQSAPVWRDL